MSRISAQLSLYPLRRVSIGPTIREAVRMLRQHDLELRMGPMSTLLCGEEQAIFAALQEAFHLSAESGDVVMLVTISNACPSLGEP